MYHLQTYKKSLLELYPKPGVGNLQLRSHMWLFLPSAAAPWLLKINNEYLIKMYFILSYFSSLVVEM